MPGQTYVPLKAFEDWWGKFNHKVESDPGFLERDIDQAIGDSGGEKGSLCKISHVLVDIINGTAQLNY